MTADEHEEMQYLQGLVKRYRRRIVELKSALRVMTPDPAALRRLMDEEPDEALDHEHKTT
jgi:hypothetical protein